MKLIKEARKLYTRLESENVKGEIVYYRKRIIKPVLNTDGSINWFNLLTGGSWGRLIGVIVFIIICLGFIFEYHNNLQVCAEAMSQLNNLSQIINTPIIFP
jgi:hypothetical protein